MGPAVTLGCDLRWCWGVIVHSDGAGVCFTCVFSFILRCTKHCKIFSGLFSEV